MRDLIEDPRIERAHRYEWWIGERSGVVEVSQLSQDSDAVNINIQDTGAGLESVAIWPEAIPVLIAALSSYHSRIGAAENEVSDA